MKEEHHSFIRVIVLNLNLVFVCLFSPFIACAMEKEAVCSIEGSCANRICEVSFLTVFAEILLLAAFGLSVAACMLAFNGVGRRKTIMALDVISEIVATVEAVLLIFIYGLAWFDFLPAITALVILALDFVSKIQGRKNA